MIIFYFFLGERIIEKANHSKIYVNKKTPYSLFYSADVQSYFLQPEPFYEKRK